MGISRSPSSKVLPKILRPTERGGGGDISPGSGLIGGPEHLSMPMWLYCIAITIHFVDEESLNITENVEVDESLFQDLGDLEDDPSIS